MGVTKSLKTDSRPLEKKPGIPLKDLLNAVTIGAQDEELFTSLANRLIRLEKQITEKEKSTFAEKANGKSVSQVAKDLLNAYNPDILENIKIEISSKMPDASPDEINNQFSQRHSELIKKAASVFNGDLNTYIENVRKIHEQVIDTINPDKIINADWDKNNKSKAEELVKSFSEWIEKHKDEITALQIFYSQPYRRRELSYKMIKELVEVIKNDKPILAPLSVWHAYEQLEKVSGQPKNELIALVSLIRRTVGIDNSLTAYDKIVDRNFQQWILKKNAGKHNLFNEEQMNWLRMIKEHISSSVHLEIDDLDYTPFDAYGGRGKMWQLFGSQMEEIITELNEVLAA